MDRNKEFDELISFAEREFSNEGYKCDFRYLQPKVYLHPDKYLNSHHQFYRDGSLVGMYLSYPTSYRGLKLEGIGTVCVREKYRNLGIMKEMMLDSLARTRADILYLSGDKRRYERYGFYICGKKLVFRLKVNKSLPKITLEEYREERQDINELLYSLYKREPGSLDRDYSSYYDLLRTKGYKPYLIIASNKIVGYLSYDDKSNRIIELVGANEYIEAAINSLAILKNKGSIAAEVGIDSPHKMLLMRLAESYKIESLTNIRLIKPCRVIEALLRAKPDLMDGELILPKINTDGNIKISVKDGKVEVVEVVEEPNLKLSAEDIYLLLFSNYLDYYDAKFDFIASWFPLDLPASITGCDGI